jgi:hypothetical protein
MEKREQELKSPAADLLLVTAAHGLSASVTF